MKTDEELINRIHPIIIEFFGAPVCQTGWSVKPGQVVQLKGSKGDTFSIADVKDSTFLEDGIDYHFNGEWHCENEILRMIKMKAFL